MTMDITSDHRDPEEAHAPAAWTLRALFTVAFLGVTAGVQMGDFGVQAISLSAIQRSFAISDAAIGALQGLAGVLVASALAIPLARFADRFSRRRVLLWLIAASTAMTLLSALAPNFPLFFVGRSASGITEFAMVPLVYSMIPDLAPERHRVTANLGFAALMALGASGGFYFGGTIIDAADGWLPFALEPWRKAFLLISLAGPVLFLLGLFVTDPTRRRAEGDPRSGMSFALFLRERWRAVGLFVGVAGFLLVAVQALNQLLTLALERRYAADPAAIGEPLGLIILATTIGCLPVAGVLDRALGRRFGQASRPVIMGAGAAAAIPCLLLLGVAGDIDRALLMTALFLFATCVANALVPTMLQDIAPASIRARSFAVWSFVVSVFSASGPLIAGALSEWVLERRLIDAIVATAVPALAISALCAANTVRMARRNTSSAQSSPA